MADTLLNIQNIGQGSGNTPASGDPIGKKQVKIAQGDLSLLDAVDGVTKRGITNMRDPIHGSDAVTKAYTHLLVGHTSSTGIISGGILSINQGDSTKFDYTDILAVFVDNTTDPLNPTIDFVTIPGATGVTDQFLATADTTFLYASSDGVVHMTDVPLTFAEARDFQHFGEMGHPNRTTQSTANNTAYFISSPTLQVQDLMVAIGMMTISGQAITPNGQNLSLNISAGSIFALGANYATDKKDPHVKYLPARSAMTFVTGLQTGAFTSTTVIDPSNYDNAGVLTSVPNNDWQVMYAFLLANGTVAIQRGQSTYATLALAKQGLGIDAFNVNPTILRLMSDGVAVQRTAIIVREDATALNNIEQCVIVDLGRFGLATGGSASGTTNLQGAYNNSESPEIITSALGGSLDLRRGSAQDTDNVLTIQNGAGTVTASITGDGVITGKIGVITEPGTTRTLQATDAGKIIRFTHASGCTVTASNLTEGQWVILKQKGAAQITLVAGTLSLDHPANLVKTAGPKASIFAYVEGTILSLAGDMA